MSFQLIYFSGLYFNDNTSLIFVKHRIISLCVVTYIISIMWPYCDYILRRFVIYISCRARERERLRGTYPRNYVRHRQSALLYSSKVKTLYNCVAPSSCDSCKREEKEEKEKEEEEDRKIGGVGEGPKSAKFNKRIHSALISRKLVDTPCRRTIPSLFLGCM